MGTSCNSVLAARFPFFFSSLKFQSAENCWKCGDFTRGSLLDFVGNIDIELYFVSSRGSLPHAGYDSSCIDTYWPAAFLVGTAHCRRGWLSLWYAPSWNRWYDGGYASTSSLKDSRTPPVSFQRPFVPQGSRGRLMAYAVVATPVTGWRKGRLCVGTLPRNFKLSSFLCFGDVFFSRAN